MNTLSSNPMGEQDLIERARRLIHDYQELGVGTAASALRELRKMVAPAPETKGFDSLYVQGVPYIRADKVYAEVERLLKQVYDEDKAHTATMEERDRVEAYADQFAEMIGVFCEVDIGEHSSANEPWENAIEAMRVAIGNKQTAPETTDVLDAVRFRWLTDDIAEWNERDYRNCLLERMSVMSYSATCAAIDAAMLEYKSSRQSGTAHAAKASCVTSPESILDRKVTVCDSCLCACCWQGDFYCDNAKAAGTVEKTIRELYQINATGVREDSGYWFKDPDTGKVDYDAKSAAKRAWNAANGGPVGG